MKGAEPAPAPQAPAASATVERTSLHSSSTKRVPSTLIKAAAGEASRSKEQSAASSSGAALAGMEGWVEERA